MPISETVYYKPSAIARPATITVIDSTHRPRIMALTEKMTFGRDDTDFNCDIKVKSSIVSRRHGEFFALDGSFYYMDCNSLNGTYVNGKKLESYNERGTIAHPLSNGDILRIDGNDLANSNSEAVLIIYSTSLASDERWSEFKLSDKSEKVSIGRGSDCDIMLDDSMVSLKHAELIKDTDKWYVRDLNSRNGVRLNGKEVSEGNVELHNFDVIRISDTMLVFFDDRILYNSGNANKVSLSVNIREKTVDPGKKTILKNVYAQFRDGDFVLILGGSGCGKTTLIKAILGEDKADGEIVLNGESLYENLKYLKPKIGAVPQFLTLRRNDTVRNTLLDTAAIKMGRSHSKKERKTIVDGIIEKVGISEHADKLIDKLSGGQQKKVSVANQMIGEQKVFICDEPDSGLDAASRVQQMEILHDLAKQDRIVMVISHEPDDAIEIVNGHVLSRFTKVLVLAKSSVDSPGQLAFLGSPDDAKKHFGVDKLQDIMIKINPADEGGEGKGDEYIRMYENRMRGAQK